MGPIEVITSVQRRRRWAPEEKRMILAEAEQAGNSLSAVAREMGSIKPALLRAQTYGRKDLGICGGR